MTQGWLHQSEPKQNNLADIMFAQFVQPLFPTTSHWHPLTKPVRRCCKMMQNDVFLLSQRQLTFSIQATNKCRDTTQNFRAYDSTFRRGASSTGPSQPVTVQLSPCWNRKFSAWSIFTLSFPQLSLDRTSDTKEHKHEWCRRETILGVVHVSPRPGLEWMRLKKLMKITFSLRVFKTIFRDGCPRKPTARRLWFNCYQLGCPQ